MLSLQHFPDGKKWIVECKQPYSPKLIMNVVKLSHEYGPVIKHVEFKVDSARVKNYIQKETRKLPNVKESQILPVRCIRHKY